jgi:hypothetical protein
MSRHTIERGEDDDAKAYACRDAEPPDDGLTVVMRRRRSAAVVVVWCLLLCCSSAHALTAREARSIALAHAKGMGTVESSEVVGSTMGAAQARLSPEVQKGELPRGNGYIVVLRGSFVYTMAKTPPGAPMPSGNVMAFSIDEQGIATETYVGDETTGLATLGGVRVRGEAVPRAASAARLQRIRARVASWGAEKCGPAVGHHCYADATWAMGGGEEVLGTESEQKTTAMDVPTYYKGDFVTNEEWVAFPGFAGTWLEIGQQGGEYVDCCSLWWFFAWSRGEGNYHQTVHIWEVTPNTWNNYGILSANNGSWCYRVGPAWEQQPACVSANFPPHSRELTDAGSVVVNGQWLDGSFHAWNFDELFHSSGTCVSRYAPVAHAGNINYGTC